MYLLYGVTNECACMPTLIVCLYALPSVRGKVVSFPADFSPSVGTVRLVTPLFHFGRAPECWRIILLCDVT